MNKSLIIFDFDGTLVDTRADLTTAVNLVRRDYGLAPLAVDVVTGFVGNGIRKLMERSLAGHPADVDEAVTRMQGHYREHMLDETVLYPGTLEGLAEIRGKGYGMAVVTNKPEQPALAICRHLGVEHFFGAVIGGDTCQNLKPHPEPLILALRLTGSALAGSWMVGDNYTDMAAGRNAGIQRCFCSYGFGRLADESHDLAIASLPELAGQLAPRAVQ